VSVTSTTAPLPSFARPAGAVTTPPRPVAGTADTALALTRRYIESLIGGDETSAYAALGGASNDRTLDLKEEAFLDKDAHITSLRASHSDATGATVDAEITASRGSYVATFHIVNGVITQHDYIKI
jgi:hypothetical protein